MPPANRPPATEPKGLLGFDRMLMPEELLGWGYDTQAVMRASHTSEVVLANLRLPNDAVQRGSALTSDPLSRLTGTDRSRSILGANTITASQ